MASRAAAGAGWTALGRRRVVHQLEVGGVEVHRPVQGVLFGGAGGRRGPHCHYAARRSILHKLLVCEIAMSVPS